MRYDVSGPKLSGSVESNEPSFLRKLKGQYGGGGAVRHERPLARPKKPKDEDEDDAPTYVVEESHNTMTKAEYEALLNQTAPQKRDEQREDFPNKPEDSTENAADEEPESTQKRANVKQQVASIGATTKRKSVKIISDNSVKVNDDRGHESSAVPLTTSKTKQTKKKVKLSFDEDVAEG